MLDAAQVEELLNSLPPETIKQIASMPGMKERIGSDVTLNPKQAEAQELLRGPAKHVMLFGGSRSGKTFLIVRDIVSRALEKKSRHAILRFRFRHVVNTIALDTFPTVMEKCFPGAGYRLDKSLWVAFLDNGSEVWFGGLDEKERTEKILGAEYGSIFLNECSQITFDAREMARTRLAQNVGLPLKMYYDCNPTSKRHWSYLLFIDKIAPQRHQPLTDPENYAYIQVNPNDNRENLDAGYLEELDSLDERKRRRFLLGIFSDEDDTALWTPEMLDKGRILVETEEDEAKHVPEMQRVIVAVDPSGCSGPEDLRSDEVGIVVCGLGVDGRGYVLEDLSGRFGPERWKTIVASAYDRHGADAVVAETNFGGAMVREVVRTAATKDGLPLAFREVKASRGKIVRAEPVAALWSQGRCSLVGRFEELEHQLCAMTTSGYVGDKSPDRADAMVWGLTAVFPAMARENRGRRKAPKVILGYQNSKRRR